MKAKSYLSVSVRFQPESLTIKQASEKLIRILIDLSEIDNIFLKPILITGQKSELPILLDEQKNDNQIFKVANGILRTEWNEITQHGGNQNPTIEYKREEGYALLLKFEKDGEIIFWVGCRIGSDLYQTFTIRDFSKNKLFDFCWYENIFKKIVNSVNSLIGTVSISNQSFGKFYNEMNIKYPVGWITFFSDSYEYSIPENLQEVRYELVESGKYLYTSDEDFMKDKDAYFEYREKLKRIITEFKERVPNFVK